MSDSQVSRRALMIAAAGSLTAAGLTAGLAGCDGQPSTPSTSPPATYPLTAVLLGQQHLLSTYEQTLSAFPELTPALSELRSQSIAHTDALIAAAPAAAAQAGPTTGLQPSGSAAASSTPPIPPPPADSAGALAAVARTVQSAAGALRAAALRAEGDLAALLGSCAASTACHARVLGL